MLTQCNTCAGVYDPVQADGSQYFHRCPPVVRVEVVRARRRQLVAPADVRPTDRVIGERLAPRPDERNENVQPSGDGTPGRPIAEGTGVTTLEDP